MNFNKHLSLREIADFAQNAKSAPPAKDRSRRAWCRPLIDRLMTTMKYQLVLQFPLSTIKDYDAVIEFEESIIQALGSLAHVDGHDAGAGEMNIFILTDSPRLAFDLVKQIPEARSFMLELRAAYRGLGEDEFTVLYPEGLTGFAIA